jgi:hypothetical protein|tara:strand:- start:6194 stop:6778 length:585 start_codon:yes stop_codon:yes gene_type:complete
MFYFKIGNIETTTPWEQPRYDKFKGWWNELNRQVDLSDYKVYLVGAFAENIYGANIPTMDVDVVLRNEIKDYTYLKKILDTAMILGFERNMFIDIKWSNEALWQDHLGIRKKCERPSKSKNVFKRIKNHKRSLKTMNGKVLSERELPKTFRVKELVNGLYEIEGYDFYTVSKVNKRIRENLYNGKFLDLKNGIR